MPFIVTRDADACPAAKPWAVHTETAHGSGKTKGGPHGCHASRKAALQQAAALYANVPDARGEGRPVPPGLDNAAEDSDRRCDTCHMYWKGDGDVSDADREWADEEGHGLCSGFANYHIRNDQVCDEYSPEPEPAEAKSEAREVSMTTTASLVSAPNTEEWRRDRARSLSASQRKRPETREVHAPLELRDGSSPETRVLRSYASLFDEAYTVRTAGYRFEEVIRPGAFKRTLGRSPDVVFRTEHSGPPLAATWSGDLRLGEDDKGLWYEVDLDENDPDVVSLISKVERGVYRESSFAFRVQRDGDRWNEEHDLREVLNCELDRGDVSVVTFGASRGTGRHMLLRSEEALAALHELGFEQVLAAFAEWRNFTLLSREERVGKVISSQSMETLRQVLGLLAEADDAVDEAEVMLSDFLGIPNPDEDDREAEGESDDDVTSAEQLDKLGRSETRNDPTYEDFDVMYGLKNIKLAIASVKAAQLCDPDNGSDPDDQAVTDALNALDSEVDAAIVAQAQDGRQDEDEDEDETNSEVADLWTRATELAGRTGYEVSADGEAGFKVSRIPGEFYWLRGDHEGVPEEERADLSAAGRKSMAKDGTAMPDGSFPIPNVAYLKKAIRAFGRAGDKGAVKAWIKKRAKALGATNLIPEGWRSTPTALIANEPDLLVDLRLRRIS